MTTESAPAKVVALTARMYKLPACSPVPSAVSSLSLGNSYLLMPLAFIVPSSLERRRLGHAYHLWRVCSYRTIRENYLNCNVTMYKPKLNNSKVSKYCIKDPIT